MQKSFDGHVLDTSFIHIPETADTVFPWTVTLYLAVKHAFWPDGHVRVCTAWPGIWDSANTFAPTVHLIPYPRKNQRHRELYQYMDLC